MKTNQYQKPLVHVLHVDSSLLLAASDSGGTNNPGGTGRDGYDDGGDPLSGPQNPIPSPSPVSGHVESIADHPDLL